MAEQDITSEGPNEPIFTHTEIDTFFVAMNGKCQCNPYRKNRGCGNKYCVGKLMSKIIGHIDSAKTSISIAMYNFTNYKIASSIKKASKRKVSVRIITDKSNSYGQVKQMKKAG